MVPCGIVFHQLPKISQELLFYGFSCTAGKVNFSNAQPLRGDMLVVVQKTGVKSGNPEKGPCNKSTK